MWRLEFLQPDDGRWTGPYCAEWMTPRAFELRERMKAKHTPDDRTRPWPDSTLFTANPGPDRYVCASDTLHGLHVWFGTLLSELLAEGGHIAAYDVPVDAIAADDRYQIIYRQGRGHLVHRHGNPIDPALLVQRIHPTKHVVRPDVTQPGAPGAPSNR